MGAVPTHITAAWVTRLLQLLSMWMPGWRCTAEQREEGEPLRSVACGSDEELQRRGWRVGIREHFAFLWLDFFFCVCGVFVLFFKFFFNFQQMVFAHDLSLRHLQPRVFWICRTSQFAFRKHNNCHMINMKLENPSDMEVRFIYSLSAEFFFSFNIFSPHLHPFPSFPDAKISCVSLWQMV